MSVVSRVAVLGVYTAASIAGASMKAASLVTTFAFLTVVSIFAPLLCK